MQDIISHANRDGLPLAQALRNQLASIPFANAFYDASSVLLSDDWKRKLEAGVASSVTVLLRTDGFDESHYCRTEAVWADQYGCPALVVDARRGLSHHPGQFDLPVDNLPSVVELLKAEGILPEKQTRVIHRPPSIRALRHACEQFSISETAALARGGTQCGFDSSEVNRMIRTIARDVLAEDARFEHFPQHGKCRRRRRVIDPPQSLDQP